VRASRAEASVQAGAASSGVGAPVRAGCGLRGGRSRPGSGAILRAAARSVGRT